VIIKGKFVTLRAIEERDLEMLRELINDPEIEQAVSTGMSFPVSSYQQSLWFEQVSRDHDTLRLVIETEEDGAVGFIGIKDINWKNRTCFPMLKLSKGKARRKGVATDAMMALMQYAFMELGFHRLDGAIVADNVASQRLFFERLGWKKEGVRREAIFYGGVYHDVIQCGIVASDYRELLERLERKE